MANKHIFIIKLTVRELGKAVGQTEARRSEKKTFLRPPPPLFPRVSMTAAKTFFRRNFLDRI